MLKLCCEYSAFENLNRSLWRGRIQWCQDSVKAVVFQRVYRISIPRIKLADFNVILVFR